MCVWYREVGGFPLPLPATDWNLHKDKEGKNVWSFFFSFFY